MKNEIDPTIKSKGSSKKIGISVLVILILIGIGVFLYKDYPETSSDTFVSDKDCDQNAAIVFEFQEGIDVDEAKAIIETYNVNYKSMWIPGGSDTVVGSICIKDGVKYFSEKEEHHPLVIELKKNNSFKKVRVELRAGPA